MEGDQQPTMEVPADHQLASAVEDGNMDGGAQQDIDGQQIEAGQPAADAA